MQQVPFKPVSFLEHTNADFDGYHQVNKSLFFHHTSGCKEHEIERGRIHRQHWFHVGKTGDQGHPFFCLFNG